MNKDAERQPWLQLNLRTLFVVVTLICLVGGFWRVSPDRGEWNLVVTATSIAFLVGLLTAQGVLLGMFCGAAFIVMYLLTLFEPDPSGLGPLSIVMPIQLAVAVIPMAVAAWCGRKLGARLSSTKSD